MTTTSNDSRNESENIAAVRKKILEGERLQTTHPEIADLRRKGRTYSQIIDEIHLREEYPQRSDETLQSYLSVACTGHKGGYRVKPFEGILSEEENTNLLKAHTRGNGLYLRDKKIGVHGLDEKGRRNNAIKANETRGCMRWDDVTLEIAYRLSQDPTYWHQDKKSRGRPDLKKILNALHIIQPEAPKSSTDSLKYQLSKYRKQIKASRNLEAHVEEEQVA
tara:strand:+ start:144 stop:806 length:663 start_codon:yes stop_codon:yes gene_type:complete